MTEEKYTTFWDAGDEPELKEEIETGAACLAFHELDKLYEAQDDQKFDVIFWNSIKDGTEEAYKVFNFKKDKKAKEAYDKIMQQLGNLSMKALFDQGIVKYLQSTLKNAAEIKWSVNKVQYRIYCFINGTKLYVMVPFIKSNGDKGTDKAGITALQRYNSMKK